MTSEREKLNLRVRVRADRIHVLDVGGILDRHTNPELDRLLAQLYEDGARRIIVNFDGLRYISSDGISLFISYLMRLRREAGDLKFYNLRAEGKTVLTVLGLSDLFHDYPDEESAAAAFTRPVEETRASDRLDVRVHEENDITYVELDGFVDRHTIDSLEEALEGLVGGGRNHLVLSCAGMTYICSAGLGIFIAQLPRLRKRGGDMKFCCLQNQARTLLNVLGLNTMFEVYETPEEAASAFER